MERKYFYAAIVGAIYGGLLSLYIILQYVLLPEHIIPIIALLFVLAPFLLPGVTVVVFTRKVIRKSTDALIAGAISGGITCFSIFITILLLIVLSSLQTNGDYTRQYWWTIFSTSGLFLTVYLCCIGSILVIAIGSIAGAIAAACALIALKMSRSLNGR